MIEVDCLSVIPSCRPSRQLPQLMPSFYVSPMKTLGIFTVALALLLSAGCGLSSTKVKIQVVEHKKEAGGAYYALLCRVLEPKDLEGRYHIAATGRSDLITNVDGAE